jgi:hypothetical protein
LSWASAAAHPQFPQKILKILAELSGNKRNDFHRVPMRGGIANRSDNDKARSHRFGKTSLNRTRKSDARGEARPNRALAGYVRAISLHL